MKIESAYRNELMKLSQLITDKKIEKVKINQQCVELINIIQKLRDEFSYKKDDVTFEFIELEKDYNINYGDIGSTNKKEMDEDKFHLNNEFSYNKNQLEKKMKDLTEEFETNKGKFSFSLEEKKKQMGITDREITNYKNALNILTKDQRQYYLEILKKRNRCKSRRFALGV